MDRSIRVQAAPVLRIIPLVLIGLCSWLLVNAIFAVAPWHMATAPEGYRLFAHLDVTIEAPNVLPALFVLFSPAGWLARRNKQMCAALLGLSIAGAVWLTFASELRSSSASYGLLVGGVAAGIVGTTSMICFFGFAYDVGGESGVSALSAGVGLSGPIAQGLGLLSDSGKRFGSADFFLSMLALQVAGGIAFLCLWNQAGGCRPNPPRFGDSSSERDRSGCCSESENSSSERSEPLAVDAEASRVGRGEIAAADGGANEKACRVAAAMCGAGDRRSVAQIVPEANAKLTEWQESRSLGASVCITAKSWANYHLGGARRAGPAALLAVGTTCVLEFSMPGLLPYLAEDHTHNLAWLTAGWATCGILGRLLASVVKLQWRGLLAANMFQALVLTVAVWYAANSRLPPFALALLTISAFSVLHGLVVTTAFVLAAQAGGIGTSYAGLVNQLGALLGSLLSLALVSSGAIPKK